MFAIDGTTARGIGEFGVAPPPGDGVHETLVSLREPSIVRLAVERRRTYAGPLEPTAANMALAERLGGAEIGAAVAIPLVVRGDVRFVLYGDNAPGARPVGPLDALESAAARDGPRHREDPRRARGRAPRVSARRALPTRAARAYSRRR